MPCFEFNPELKIFLKISTLADLVCRFRYWHFDNMNQESGLCYLNCGFWNQVFWFES
jgi:hypothetical protein